jgi:hypothetical protein
VWDDNCYSNQSNNPEDWPDGWTTLVPPSNDLLSPTNIQMHHIHPCKTPTFILCSSFHPSRNRSSSNLIHPLYLLGLSFFNASSCIYIFFIFYFFYFLFLRKLNISLKHRSASEQHDHTILVSINTTFETFMDCINAWQSSCTYLCCDWWWCLHFPDECTILILHM